MMVARNLLLFAALVTTPLAQAGILSHWTFDTQNLGITPDSVGNVDGTLTGGAHLVSGGVSGNAVSLTNFIPTATFQQYVGMGDHYDFSWNSFTGAAAFTTSAWIKPQTNGNVGHVVSNLESPGDGGGWAMTVNFGAASGSISAYTGSVGTQLNGTVVSTHPDNIYDLFDGGWHHLVMTYSGGLTPQVSMWVDGKLAKNGPFDVVGAGGHTGQPSYRTFVVGGNYFINRASNIGTYDGLIDDVQLYDSALGASEIQSLYLSPGQNLTDLNAVPEPSTLALLSLAGLVGFASRRHLRK